MRRRIGLACKTFGLVMSISMVSVIAGCYDHVRNGDQSKYQFAWWVGLTLMAGSLVCIPVGWLMYNWVDRIGDTILGIPVGEALRRWTSRWGIMMMGGGVLVLVLLVPSMYTDRVLVDANHFEGANGLWFYPSLHNLNFQDLHEIRLITQHGSRRTSFVLQCKARDGQVTELKVGTLLEQAVPEILARAMVKGVAIVAD
jgi:hypothetical protein